MVDIFSQIAVNNPMAAAAILNKYGSQATNDAGKNAQRLRNLAVKIQGTMYHKPFCKDMCDAHPDKDFILAQSAPPAVTESKKEVSVNACGCSDKMNCDGGSCKCGGSKHNMDASPSNQITPVSSPAAHQSANSEMVSISKRNLQLAIGALAFFALWMHISSTK